MAKWESAASRWATTLCVIVGFSACGGEAVKKEEQQPNMEKVREAAVAGMFYEADPKALTETMERMLADAETVPLGKIRALVAPHAGYVYSGPTAAVGYKQLLGKKYKTVFVLAPSHRVAFKGAAVPDARAFRTPLGLIPISPQAALLTKTSPFITDSRPHAQEHSLEVQLPFLQRVLGEFELAPIVFGQLDEARAAAILAPLLDENSLLIASSDLSHYLPYEEAKAKDAACVKAACTLDVEAMADADACGKGPMLTLLHIARQKGWKAKLLDYRTSGDTAGKKDAVVGYMTVAFYEEEKSDVESDVAILSADDKNFLLRLARQTIEKSVKNERTPAVDETKLSAALKMHKGCFVTLHKDGNLRGCIGNIVPRGALYAAVMDNACAAALRDWRFQPVTAAEVEQLHLEISVLTAPQNLPFQTPEELLAKLRPNVDGVVLIRGRNQATYLPQVWEQLPKKEDFLSSLARKADLPADAWRKPGLQIETYQVELFEEEKPGKATR